jgi:hypothetical protein
MPSRMLLWVCPVGCCLPLVLLNAARSSSLVIFCRPGMVSKVYVSYVMRTLPYTGGDSHPFQMLLFLRKNRKPLQRVFF